MPPSVLTAGLALIFFAVVGPAVTLLSPVLGTHVGRLTPLTSFASVPLLLGGIAMLMRRPWSFWVAITGGAVVALSGAAGMLLHHPIGTPLQPLAAFVLGLYVCFRIAIARPGLSAVAPRPMIADELADDLSRERERQNPPPA